MKIVDKIFEQSFHGLSKAMDLYMQRANALSSNLANIETPGYRAVDVSFGSELERAFQKNSPQNNLFKTEAAHMDVDPSKNSHLVGDYSGATRADGNNVDLDIQIGKMMFNSGEYSKAANILRRQLGMMKELIRQGRG